MGAFEQRNRFMHPKSAVKLVGVGGGVSYGTLGPTHHSIVDLAIMRSLPNMTVISPTDLETRKATIEMMKIDGPVYLRLGMENNLLNKDYKLIGKNY